MISRSNEQLQQQLEYTLLKTHCLSSWISKMQSDTLEERLAIKLCFKLGKMPQKQMECFRLLFDHLAWIELQFLSGIIDSRESVRDDERCGRCKEVNTLELIGQRVRVTVTRMRFYRSSGRDSLGRCQQPSNRVSGISTMTMHQSTTPSLSQTIWARWASRKFHTFPIVQTLLPKLGSCRYETIEVMKEAVTKVIDTLTQQDFQGAFRRLLER